MKNIFLKLMALVLVSALVTSCQKKVNDWEVDPSHDRLFKSLTFSYSKLGSTFVELNYTQSVSANKYIFEFSKDSLAFKEIVRTVEVLADTLTPFAPSPTPTKVAYHTMFEDLDGKTGYSVRMKSVDTVTGTESKYSQIYFVTTAEQLFSGWDVSTDHIKMSWKPTDRVTHITVVNAATNEEVQKITLTDADKQAGSVDITKLSAGTSYSISIYNDDVVRGTKILKTSGLQGAMIIRVNPGDDIVTLLKDAVTQGKPNVTLLFKAGQTYDIGTLILPAGLSNISFTGESADANNTTRAVLNVKEIRLSDVIFGKMIFEKVTLVGGTGDFLINMATDNVEMEDYNFVNCTIANYRSVVRIQNKVVKLRQITFDNSIVQTTGDYGVVNVGGTSVTLDSIKFTNNTMVEMATQLMDVRSTVQGIRVNHNTIYNQNKALTQLIRLDKNNLPTLFEGANNIISGTNAGVPLKSFSLAYDGSFAGSYRTNEMSIGQDFTNITVFNGAASALFVDPTKWDFTLNPDAGFGGKGTAGDPRWY